MTSQFEIKLNEEGAADTELVNLEEEHELDQDLEDETLPEVGIFKQPRSLLNNDQIMSSSPIVGYVFRFVIYYYSFSYHPNMPSCC